MQTKIKRFFSENYILISVVFLSIILRVLYFEHVDFDEVMYVTAAKNIIAGQYDITTVPWAPTLRYFFMFLVTVLVYLLGTSHYAVSVLPFVSTLITITCVYFIGKKLVNKKVGLISALLVAIFPLNIKYASMLEADVVITALMGVCFVLYLYKKEVWFFFLIGVILGLGMFIKFFIALIGVIISLELLKKQEFKAIIVIILGALLSSSPFLLYNWSNTGDFLYHIHEDQRLVNDYNEKVILSDSTQLTSFVPYLLNPFFKKPEQSLFNVYFILILSYFYYSIKRKEWNYGFFWLWLISGYLVLELPSIIPPVQRYLMIIIIPLVILLGIWLGKIEKKTHLSLVLVILLFISLFQLGEFTVFDNTPRTSEQRISILLKSLPPKDVYVTHNNQVGYLTYYLDYNYNYSGLFGYQGYTNHAFYDLHFVDNLSAIRNAYVVIDYRLITDGTDIMDYYAKNNGSIAYITDPKVPEDWHGIYGLTDGHGNIVGGVWDVK